MSPNVLAATQSLADAIRAELSEPESLQLVTISEAAKLLGVGNRRARTLLGETVELGQKTKRYKLASIKNLIESRTI